MYKRCVHFVYRRVAFLGVLRLVEQQHVMMYILYDANAFVFPESVVELASQVGPRTLLVSFFYIKVLFIAIAR